MNIYAFSTNRFLSQHLTIHMIYMITKNHQIVWHPNFSHRICIPIDTVYAVFALILNQIFDHYYQRFRIICTLSHSALASLPFTCPVKTTRQQPQQTTIIIFRFHSTNQSVRPPTRPLPNEMSGKDKVARPAENNFSFKN